MPKRAISVDFDDVVMDFHRGFMGFHNTKYGTRISYEQLVRYDDWEIVYGNSKETMTDRAREFYLSPEQQLVAPVAGAVEAIADLARDYSLHIVTSRPEEVKPYTLPWIEKYFPNMFTDFHFTNIYAAREGIRSRTKSEVCREIGSTLLIDDALRHVREVTNAGINALLPDRP